MHLEERRTHTLAGKLAEMICLRKTAEERLAAGESCSDQSQSQLAGTRDCRNPRPCEHGRTLPSAMWILAFSALLMGSFLAHIRTSLQASRDSQTDTREQYAASSGAEFGIWKLMNDSGFRSQVDSDPGTPVSVNPPISVNQITTNITATAVQGSSNTWESKSSTSGFGAGSALAHTGNDYVFALQGGGSAGFWRYSISSDSWAAMANLPLTVAQGGSLAYTGGDLIYAIRGGSKKEFYAYSISGNSWSSRTRLPVFPDAGASLAYAGSDHIYLLLGGSSTGVIAYTISTDSWSAKTDIPGAVSSGGDLAWAGSDYLYAVQGGSSTSFWRYSISGDSWTQMASTPASVAAGGALAHTGGNYIYAYRGGSTTTFWRYSISGDAWTSMASVPTAVSSGAGLAYASGQAGIFGSRGGGQVDFWMYKIQGTPTYDVNALAGGFSITTRVEIVAGSSTITSWEIE